MDGLFYYIELKEYNPSCFEWFIKDLYIEWKLFKWDKFLQDIRVAEAEYKLISSSSAN